MQLVGTLFWRWEWFSIFLNAKPVLICYLLCNVLYVRECLKPLILSTNELNNSIWLVAWPNRCLNITHFAGNVRCLLWLIWFAVHKSLYMTCLWFLHNYNHCHLEHIAVIWYELTIPECSCFHVFAVYFISGLPLMSLALLYVTALYNIFMFNEFGHG